MVPACSNDAQGEQALDTITHPGAPCVVKDDSLAFGKGVIVT
jgi:phosphoribosylamine-glycine ligase